MSLLRAAASGEQPMAGWLEGESMYAHWRRVAWSPRPSAESHARGGVGRPPGSRNRKLRRRIGDWKAHTPYQHEALLYQGTADFLHHAVPFIRDGLEAGEPVLVVTAQT